MHVPVPLSAYKSYQIIGDEVLADLQPENPTPGYAWNVSKEKYEHTLQRCLSELIPTLQDPRIPMIVTIEEVHLSRDGKQAKILVSTLEDEDVDGMITALNRAAGYLQHEVADILELRFTPKLSFHTDRLEVL